MRWSTAKDLDVLDELVTEDVVNHSATDEHKPGIEGFRHVSQWGIALLPDGRYELLDMIAEGDMVACRVRVSGTMQGELFGVPPTGKSFVAEHVHWHRVVGGKLAERWAVRDDLGTLIQLGIIDPPHASVPRAWKRSRASAARGTATRTSPMVMS